MAARKEEEEPQRIVWMAPGRTRALMGVADMLPLADVAHMAVCCQAWFRTLSLSLSLDGTAVLVRSGSSHYLARRRHLRLFRAGPKRLERLGMATGCVERLVLDDSNASHGSLWALCQANAAALRRIELRSPWSVSCPRFGGAQWLASSLPNRRGIYGLDAIYAALLATPRLEALVAERVRLLDCDFSGTVASATLRTLDLTLERARWRPGQGDPEVLVLHLLSQLPALESLTLRETHESLVTELLLRPLPPRLSRLHCVLGCRHFDEEQVHRCDVLARLEQAAATIVSGQTLAVTFSHPPPV